MKDIQHVHLQATATGPTRTETLMGREYLVVPAVLVRSQVLHNNLGATYLPPEEVTDSWAEAANGAPVVIGEHPTRRGVAISARSPDVLNTRGAGFLFRARAEDASLKADVYLDTNRTSAVPELTAVLDKLERHERVELSTGFPVVLEEQKGMAGNEAFDFVMHPAGYDHLAVFGGETKGACSVEDGCGLGANAATDPPPDKEKTMQVSESKGFLARAFAAMGDALGLFPDAANESDEDRRKALSDAVRAKWGGLGKDIWVEAVFSEEGLVVFEIWSGGDAGLYQASFEMDEEGGTVTLGDAVKVRRETSFVPVANSGEGKVTPPEEGEVAAMKRQEIVARLKELRPCMAEKLEAMSDAELVAIHEFAEKDPPKGGEQAGEGAPPEGGGEEGGDAALQEAVANLTKVVNGIGAQLDELKQVTAPAIEEQKREREGLVAELVANERVAFTWDELNAMSLEGLRKVQAMARGVSYAARGGPRSVNAEKVPEFLDPVPYFSQAPEAGKEN